MTTAINTGQDALINRLLKESTGRCGNPSCRNRLDEGKIQAAFVFQADIQIPDNLLLLCANCHDTLYSGTVPSVALQAWKILQLAASSCIGEKPLDLRLAAVRNHTGLRKFFPTGYALYPTACGPIYLDIHESPMMLARAMHVYEPEKTETIREFLQPGQTFIDIGANKGDFTLLAAKLIGDKGQVLSFEPEPDNFSWLQKSIAHNGYGNIITTNTALADSEGPATLYIGEKSGWHSLVAAPGTTTDGRSIRVECATLDRVLSNDQISQVDMIKIDVEGAEMQVLQGARETLARHDDLLLLIDIHPHRGVRPVDLCTMLIEAGYRIHDIGTGHRRLDEYPDTLTEILACRHLPSSGVGTTR